MNKSQKLQAVTEAIHKACPDLLELRYGCQIEWKAEMYHGTRTGVLLNKKYNSMQYLEVLEARKMQDYNNEDFIQYDVITIEGVKAKILGQPIGIAEVLRAIRKEKNIHTYTKAVSNLLFTNHESEHFSSDQGKQEFNLTKTLDQQEEPVISLLYNIFYL